MALNLTNEASEDNKITKCQYQAFYPSESSLTPGQDIHIVVQNAEITVLPSQGYLHLKYKITPEPTKPYTDALEIYNNGPLYFFSDFRYNLNSIEIDKCRNPGVSTLMKALPSWNYNKKTDYLSMPPDYSTTRTFINYVNGHCSTAIPLSYIFGFAEDNKKAIFNARHEIIATLSSADKIKKLIANLGDKESIELTSVVLYMPVLEVSDEERIKMLKILQSGIYLPVQYRSWELNEFPMPQATSGIWNVKVTSEIEKPRFVIFGMKTSSAEVTDSSFFARNTLSNAKLFLNGSEYPYEPLNLSTYQYENAYKMYENFRRSYYGQNIERDSPFLKEYDANSISFYNYFLICFDCSRQNDTVKSGPVNVVIKYEAISAIPANTTGYCLIIYDRHTEYNPLTNLVQQIL